MNGYTPDNLSDVILTEWVFRNLRVYFVFEV
jgi:hypothetical protein